MPMFHTVLVTHPAPRLAMYLGDRALQQLRQVAQVRLNPLDVDLAGPALVDAAQGCDVILAYRQTPVDACAFATLPGLRAVVRCAGLVTCRQRPGTASGVIFVTLEDETGSANVVVFNDLASRQRRLLLGSRLLGVAGQLQVEGEGEHAVVHLVAKRLFDHSELLGTLLTASRDFH